MKRSNLILLSGANYLISLLDKSEQLFWEECQLKRRLCGLEYLKKQNSKEIIAACDQVQEVNRETTTE